MTTGRPIGSRDRRGRCIRLVSDEEEAAWIRRVGPRVKTLCSEQDIAASELACAVGVNPMTVVNWMSGRRNPTLGHCYRIVTALGVQISDLLDEEP